MGMSLSWKLGGIQTMENFLIEESKAVISKHSSEISSVGWSTVLITPSLRVWPPYSPLT